MAVIAVALLALPGCSENVGAPLSASTGAETEPVASQALPVPAADGVPIVGWARHEKPTSAPGTRVVAFASGLHHPRWLLALPNGDVLVAETNALPKVAPRSRERRWSSARITLDAEVAQNANRITLLRDTDGDGVADLYSTLLHNLNSPFGMALLDNELYVANSDAVLRFPYEPGAMTIHAPGVMVMQLPVGELDHQWSRNLITDITGRRLYVSMGADGTSAQADPAAGNGHAAVWEVDTASGKQRLFASGLHHPSGMAWEPTGGALWAVINQYGASGSALVPDYLISVQDSGFYDWPFSYLGQRLDHRVQPAHVVRSIMPDYVLGAHTVSLGLASSAASRLPAPFVGGMFVGQHGSGGYKVIHIPFAGGRPSGVPVDLLSGFLNEHGQAQGRPVGLTLDLTGALLVADDVGGVVWRVRADEPAIASAAN
ncbi:PQQ-dependent sugar dehydrogenase [Panacagrimonas sp.]|uniref:PQQ-dependent sugar dehydrogenase n=1 Tax=Panacagrimonas sp. TaxID=2480088 RepID=UPI003B51A402